MWNAQFPLLITQPATAHAYGKCVTNDNGTMKNIVAVSALEMEATAKKTTNDGTNSHANASASMHLIFVPLGKNGALIPVGASRTTTDPL